MNDVQSFKDPEGQTGMAAVESEAKDAYNNYQQDDQGGKLNTTEFAEQEYKDFTQPQSNTGNAQPQQQQR
ncbi:TPA: hypothetical protein ACH3X2_008391 [Trebouxia sp. C0005]